MRALRGIGIIAVLAAWLVFGAAGHLRNDEMWMVQIVDRMQRGQMLYRDVFYGCLPLGVYVLRGFAAVFGNGVLMVRFMKVACELAWLPLGWALLEAYGALSRWRWVYAGCLVTLAAVDYWINPYAPMAALGLGWAWLLVEREGRDPRWWRPWLIGMVVGLMIGTKQNVGAMAAMAVAATMWRSPGKVLKSAMAAGLVIVVTLVTVPPEAWPAMWEQTVGNKGTYLRDSRLGYLTGVVEWWPTVLAGRWGEAWDGLKFFVAPWSVVVILMAGWRRRTRCWWVAGAFLLASCCTLFPMAGAPHLSAVMPLMLAALMIGTTGVTSAKWPEWALGAVSVVMGMWFVAAPVMMLVRGEAVWSRLPHARGVLIERGEEDRYQREVTALKGALGAGSSVVLLNPYASLHYLEADLRNASRNDYPVSTTYSPADTAEEVGRIQAGRYERVCLDRAYYGSSWPSRWVPRELEAATRESMVKVADLGVCTLYGKQ